ncbi:MAG TPA: cytochrome c [Bryobacteraceae bacterium]|nr:cytochrome c [Bryobacteraceae bacterium]
MIRDNLQMGPRVAAVLLSMMLTTAGRTQSTPEARGKDVFRACGGCHNVLTDARRAGPSLRTLFGKVRLINGKRALEQNVRELVTEGYNGMPSYKNLLRPQDWEDLMAYLKTLRGRPEINAVLRPIRGADDEVLSNGKKVYLEQCGACHAQPANRTPEILTVYKRSQLANGDSVQEATILRRIREGHGGMPTRPLEDAVLFSLIAYLKAQ